MAALWIRTAGTVLLAALIGACLPLTVPRLMGYQIYSVISGSMEPAVPTGSLVYIQEGDPADLEEGDVIAFYGGGDGTAIITHRVVENRVLMGELITKGDANREADISPVPYARCIGREVLTIPGAGRLAELITGQKGRWAAGGVILAAVGLQLLAALLERKGGSGR